jgi:hypothetical protein
MVATRWQGCAMPNSVCGNALLQIVARLRHAVIGQDRRSRLFSFRPLGLNLSVETRPSTDKIINLGEVAHLPPCMVATRWQGCAMPNSVCGNALLQIVARLRHAVIGQDRRLFHCSVRMRAKDFSPLRGGTLDFKGLVGARFARPDLELPRPTVVSLWR